MQRFLQGLPLARKDLIDEDSEGWHTVAIPVDPGTLHRWVGGGMHLEWGDVTLLPRTT